MSDVEEKYFLSPKQQEVLLFKPTAATKGSASTPPKDYLFLHPDASILHLSGGLHNYWDGLALLIFNKFIHIRFSPIVIIQLHLDLPITKTFGPCSLNYSLFPILRR